MCAQEPGLLPAGVTDKLEKWCVALHPAKLLSIISRYPKTP